MNRTSLLLEGRNVDADARRKRLALRPVMALVLVGDETIDATTSPRHRCDSSWPSGRVVRVGTVRSARSPLQHGLRALLVRGCPGGDWCTVHFRSKNVQFVFGESSWSWLPPANAAVHRESWSRPRDFHHGTKH